MKIFISYRRDDTKDLAGRICDRLRGHFGDDSVFIDSGSISTGDEWRRRLNKELYACDALIAVIGDDWLELRDEEGRRRIDNPDDEVRREIVTALERDIPVIPLLVERVEMPAKGSLPQPLQKLHERQWYEVRSDQYFESDINDFCRKIDKLVAANRKLRIHLAAVTFGLLMLLFGIGFYAFRKPVDPVPRHDLTAIQMRRLEQALALQRDLSQISTLVNRYLAGEEVPGLIEGRDIPRLTAVFERLNAERGLIGDEFHGVLADEGRTLIRLVNDKQSPELAAQDWGVFNTQMDRFNKLVEEFGRGDGG